MKSSTENLKIIIADLYNQGVSLETIQEYITVLYKIFTEQDEHHRKIRD